MEVANANDSVAIHCPEGKSLVRTIGCSKCGQRRERQQFQVFEDDLPLIDLHVAGLHFDTPKYSKSQREELSTGGRFLNVQE